MEVFNMQNQITENPRDFMLGGHASFIIRQEVDGNVVEYEYSITKAKGGKCWYVSVLENGNFVYCGYLNSMLDYYRGNKGNYESDYRPVKGLLWVLKHSRNLPSQVKVIHRGICSVCNRKLKDEESVKWGIGPVCRKKLGI